MIICNGLTASIGIAAWLADEAISPRFLIGAAIVLVGVWAGAILRPASETEVDIQNSDR